MSNPSSACQQEAVWDFSRLSCPYPLVLVRRFVWYLKTRGVRGAARKTLEFVRQRLPGGPRPRTRRPSPGTQFEPAVLELKPGDLVEIKSENEILATLDTAGKQRGLSFLPEMRKYCGQRFTVHKKLERIFLEESKQIRRMKNTVTLDGVMCQGEGIGCDRSCFFYWREAWLRRVHSDGPTK